MTGTTRRQFLHQTGTALAAAAFWIDKPLPLLADPLGRPVGLQLYTLGEQLGKDFDGTLARVAAIGYKEVETAGFFNKKPNEFRSSLDKAGLVCRSVHIWGPPQTRQKNFEQAVGFAHGLGAAYVVTSLIAPKRAAYSVEGHPFNFAGMTIEDYKSIAGDYNRLGGQAKKAGLQLAYHNHDQEFRPLKNGATGYDELIRRTDSTLLKLEMDCGWMRAAGHDPVAYLTKYPDRYRMLHIKDFKLGPTPSYGEKGSAPSPTELGRGSINYKPIFAAAKKAGVEWYFVEQEPPFNDMPAMQAIKVDYDYLHNLTT